MRKRNVLLPIVLLGLSPWAAVSAKARVVGSTEHPATRSEKSCSPAETSRSQEVSQRSQLKKKEFHHHAASGSLALRWLNVDNFVFDSFNERPVADVLGKSNRDIVLDYSLMYHYRPTPSYSFGLSFDRLQVSRTDVDLRYLPSAQPYPDVETWDLVGSDLNPAGNAAGLSATPTAVGNFYHPEKIGNRGYCYEMVARAYILPSMEMDPFVQVTIGVTHNRTAVHRADLSRSIEESDQTWTWSVGAGGSYALNNEGLSLETVAQVRDQHGFDIKDQLSSDTTSTIYTLIGSCEKYYSVDLKVSLRQTW